MRTAFSSRGRLATISSFFAIAFASGLTASPAVASEVQDAYFQHHIECARLLWSDPEAHAEQCLPSRIIGTLGSTSGTGPGTPKREDPPKEECYPPVYALTSTEGGYDGCECTPR